MAFVGAPFAIGRLASSRSAENAEQSLVIGRGFGGGFRERFLAIDAGGALNDSVSSAIANVDFFQVGVGNIFIARDEVLPLGSVPSDILIPAGADHDVHARQRLFAMRNRGKPDHVARDVLIVVAKDIVGIRGGRRCMADRHARHRADGPAIALQLVGDRFDLPALRIDIHRVVVGFDSSRHRRGGR